MSTDELKATIIGSAGGKRRAEVLSAQRRSEIARMGAYGRLRAIRAAKEKHMLILGARDGGSAVTDDGAQMGAESGTMKPPEA